MKTLKIFLFYLATLSVAFAHGPDGDHAHDDAPAAQSQPGARPRIDAATESFELVGQLQGKELSILVDRFETNEPVLNGKLEVELNGMKAPAAFRPDHGDYVVNDAAFLKALSKPGKHAMVFTLTAADESDLLEGALEVKPVAPAADHSHFPWTQAAIGLLIVLALTALAVRFRRNKNSIRN